MCENTTLLRAAKHKQVLFLETGNPLFKPKYQLGRKEYIKKIKIVYREFLCNILPLDFPTIGSCHNADLFRLISAHNKLVKDFVNREKNEES